MRFDLDRALDAGLGRRAPVLIDVDGSQVAVRVGKTRIGPKRALVGIDGIPVGRTVRVELATAPEPLERALLLKCTWFHGVSPPRQRRHRVPGPCPDEVQDRLAVGLEQNPVVPDHDAPGAFRPDAESAEGPLQLGDSPA